MRASSSPNLSPTTQTGLRQHPQHQSQRIRQRRILWFFGEPASGGTDRRDARDRRCGALSRASFVTGEHIEGGQGAGHCKGSPPCRSSLFRSRARVPRPERLRYARAEGGSDQGSKPVAARCPRQAAGSDLVVIEEVEMEKWGWDSLPVAEYREKLAKASGAL
jgi:hypothetical protein